MKKTHDTAHHQYFLEAIREKHGDHLLPEMTDNILLHAVFVNIRGKDFTKSKGFRLTAYGFSLLRDMYKLYSVQIKDFHTFGILDHTFLDSKNVPYFIDDSTETFYTFNGRLAVFAKLAGGDIKKMREIETFR